MARQRVRATAVAFVIGISSTVSVLVVTATPAEAATTVSKRLRTAIADLPAAAETRSGYARSKFSHWADANGDCQDTRSEVLRAETKSTVKGSCAVSVGKWLSYYDNATWTKASDVDIDHMVPLAEAWDSGARKWTASTRKAYANDLGDKRTLVAVTDNVNQSKGDKDPAQWMPSQNRCRYLREWVAVKIRWSLKVDATEKSVLTSKAKNCENATITVTKAKVSLATSTPSTGGGTGSTTDPRFDYCYNAQAAGYGPYVQGRDPEYAWYDDRDNDGVVCE